MPRVVDHDRQRADLLAGSFALFARKGYSSVTMRELADELGVSTGTLYHYFGGKRDLFARLLERLAAADVAEVTGAVPATAPLADRVAVLVGYVVNRRADLLDALRIALEALRPGFDRAAVAAVGETLAAYQEALAGFLAVDRATAAGVFDLLTGRLLRSAFDRDAIDRPRLAARVLRLLPAGA